VNRVDLAARPDPRRRIACRRAIAGFLATTLVLACGGNSTTGGTPPLPDPTYGGGDFFQLLSYQGLDRGYTVHVPATATPQTAAPLLIVLHGSGQDAPGIRGLAAVESLTDPLGWIVVYPDGVERSWAVGTETPADLRGVDDVGFIDRMIDRIDRHLNLDRDRVFAAGLSNGALMTHRLACDLSSEIRGIASVAGAMYSGLADRCSPERPVRAVFFNGDDDDFFPWDGFPVVGGERIFGVLETAEWWATENGCGPASVVDIPDAEADGTTVDLLDYANCSSGAPVRLYAVENGGHTWPGRGGIGRTSQDIEANLEMLAFFGAGILQQ